MRIWPRHGLFRNALGAAAWLRCPEILYLESQPYGTNCKKSAGVCPQSPDDDYLKAFVDQVRKNFIDRIARMGDGHVVPWGNEFTVDNLNSPASKGERAK